MYFKPIPKPYFVCQPIILPGGPKIMYGSGLLWPYRILFTAALWRAFSSLLKRGRSFEWLDFWLWFLDEELCGENFAGFTSRTDGNKTVISKTCTCINPETLIYYLKVLKDQKTFSKRWNINWIINLVQNLQEVHLIHIHVSQ